MYITCILNVSIARNVRYVVTALHCHDIHMIRIDAAYCTRGYEIYARVCDPCWFVVTSEMHIRDTRKGVLLSYGLRRIQHHVYKKCIHVYICCILLRVHKV